MKTSGAQNRRRTADVFPTSRSCVSPRPESNGCTSALDKANEKPGLSGWPPVCEGVLKHRSRRKSHPSHRVKEGCKASLLPGRKQGLPRPAVATRRARSVKKAVRVRVLRVLGRTARDGEQRVTREKVEKRASRPARSAYAQRVPGKHLPGLFLQSVFCARPLQTGACARVGFSKRGAGPFRTQSRFYNL